MVQSGSMMTVLLTYYLSLNNAKMKYHVTYDSTACDCFEVHKADAPNVYLSHPKWGYSTHV